MSTEHPEKDWRWRSAPEESPAIGEVVETTHCPANRRALGRLRWGPETSALPGLYWRPLSPNAKPRVRNEFERRARQACPR
ncbi:MAG: hypothetical protein JWO56_2647 [Acidobacteria bacterium]|nr:hypothetical protein [Acidobacteriota bacterium]